MFNNLYSQVCVTTPELVWLRASLVTNAELGYASVYKKSMLNADKHIVYSELVSCLLVVGCWLLTVGLLTNYS